MRHEQVSEQFLGRNVPRRLSLDMEDANLCGLRLQSVHLGDDDVSGLWGSRSIPRRFHGHRSGIGAHLANSGRHQPVIDSRYSMPYGGVRAAFDRAARGDELSRAGSYSHNEPRFLCHAAS